MSGPLLLYMSTIHTDKCDHLTLLLLTFSRDYENSGGCDLENALKKNCNKIYPSET